jgi:hypothetical protein
MPPAEEGPLRALAPFNTVSALGAGIAGLGLGALLASPLRPLAWPILLGGTAVHLFAMIGRRRVLLRQGQRQPLWEQVGYWLCWAIVAAAALALGWGALQ